MKNFLCSKCIAYNSHIGYIIYERKITVNDKNIIEETAQITATKVIFELRRQGFLKDSRQTPFQKTETLLYNYKNFQAAIADKQKQIEIK